MKSIEGKNLLLPEEINKNENKFLRGLMMGYIDTFSLFGVRRTPYTIFQRYHLVTSMPAAMQNLRTFSFAVY